MRPLLSVIIPVYNTKEYLESCLASLNCQGIDEEQLEIICVDDCSTDGSGDWLDEYASSHGSVTVIHQEHGGVSSARNRGMDVMTGKFFEFIDSDDFLFPDTIGRILEAMEKNQCDVAQFGYTRDDNYRCSSEFKYKISTMTLSGMVSRYIFESERFGQLRFDEGLHFGEDTFFAQTVALFRPRCLCTECKCYMYRRNPNSLMNTRDFLASAASMLKLAGNHKAYLDENRFPDSKKRVRKWCARATAGYIYYSLRGGREDDPFPMLKERGLWPYKKEWQLLLIHIRKNGGLRQTASNYCLFFCGFRPTWKLLKRSRILNRSKD